MCGSKANAGDEHVEARGRASRAASRRSSLDGAELGADQHARALALAVAVRVAALGGDEPAGPGLKGVERQPVRLLRLLHAGDLELLEDHGAKSARWASGSVPEVASGSSGWPSSSTPITRCGLRLSTVNGPATRTLSLSSYGLS